MRIGCHISGFKNIIDAIHTAIELEANCFQIFVSSPLSRVAGKKIENYDEVKEIVKKTKMVIMVHGKYIINYANINNWNIQALVCDLKSASYISDNIGVIIHQPKNVSGLPIDEVIDIYINNVKKVIDETKELNNPIILENSAHQKSEIGYELKELGYIWNSFPIEYRKRLGICIDTCHAFVSGMLSFKNEEIIDKFFKDFDNYIGINNLKVIHINDSKVKFGSCVDRHEDIGKGYILDENKGGNLIAFKRFLYHCNKHNIPLILETPGNNQKDEIKLLRKWIDEII